MPKRNDYYSEIKDYYTNRLNELIPQLPKFVDDYMLSISQNKQVRTRLGYCEDIKTFLLFASDYLNGNYNIKEFTLDDLEKITADDIDRYMDYLSYYRINGVEYTNSENGKARKISSISGLYTYLVKRDRIKSNPIDKIQRPVVHKKNVIAMDQEQIYSLIDSVTNGDNLTARQKKFHEKTVERDLAIVMLFLGTGIRISELVGLDVKDIDFNDQSIRVIRKGGNEDIVYFGDEVYDALEVYLTPIVNDMSPRDLLLSSPIDALFVSLRGQRMTVRTVEKMVEKYCEGVINNKHITPHKLRSTYATNLYKNTGDVFLVSKTLGHSSIETSKKYVDVNDDHKRKAADVMSLKRD